MGVRKGTRLSCLRISRNDNNDAVDVIASRIRHLHDLRQVVLLATLAQKRRVPTKPAKSMVELALRVRAPTVSLKFPLTAMLPPLRSMAALSFTAFSAVTRKEPPEVFWRALAPLSPEGRRR